MSYGLTIENVDMIHERSKTRNNGCYSFRGVQFKVVNKCVTHLAYYGDIYNVSFGFNVKVGTYKHYGSDSGKKGLSEIIL